MKDTDGCVMTHNTLLVSPVRKGKRTQKSTSREKAGSHGLDLRHRGREVVAFQVGGGAALEAEEVALQGT